MLKVKNVSKQFGSTAALDDLSFDVAKGEFVFVTGPSGSGKTTLVRIILGDLKPDTGEIVFNNQNVSSLSKKEIPIYRRAIGVVFQDYKLLPERTVRENIEIVLAVIKLPQEEWDQRVNSVLKTVSLEDRAEFFPAQLSGGELQRAVIARALVVEPKMLLADEPTGNLDWDTAEEIIKLFEEINKSGMTVVMATHHRVIVEKLGKKEIKLKKAGKIKRQEPKKVAKDKK